MKRILSIMLLCSFLFLALVACNQKKPDATQPVKTDGPTGTTTEKDQYDQNKFISAVPVDDLDFEGENIVVLARNDSKVSREWKKDETGDELDEAIRTRNEEVADALNINVTVDLQASSNAGDCESVFTRLISNDINNDLHEYDIAAHFAYFAVTTSIRDYNANLLDKEQFKYFDFSLPCWNQAIAKNGTINGKNFFCAGDLNLSLFNSAMVIWHNKTLYDQYKTEEDPADIQDLVLDNEWTAAHLYQWSTFVADTAQGGPCGDTYGIYMYDDSDPFDVVPHAWAVDLMTVNNDGTHAYNVVGNQKAEEAISLFRDIYSGEGNSRHHTKQGNCQGSCGFIESKVIFATGTINFSEEESLKRREMEDKYAILPYPMYDEGQEGGYATTSQDWYTLMSILDHSGSSVPTKNDAVCAYLQLATEKSYTDVRGYYFKMIIEPKFFGVDDEDGTVTKSITIFNTIVDNIRFEYWTLYSASLGNIVHLFRGTLKQTGMTLEQRYQASKATYDKALAEADVWFGLVSETTN